MIECISYSIQKENTTCTVKIMANQNKELSRWMLTRQRFHIADYRPPVAPSEERAIGTILSGIMQTEPVEEELPSVLTDRWGLITGGQVAKHTTPAQLRNGVLYVHADHPGWLSEIRRLPKAHLLKKLAAIPEAPEITDIRFLLDPALRTKGIRKK
jgi:hypothetical protein